MASKLLQTLYIGSLSKTYNTIQQCRNVTSLIHGIIRAGSRRQITSIKSNSTGRKWGVFRYRAAVALFPTVAAFGFGKKNSESNAPAGTEKVSEEEALINKCDILFNDTKLEELYACLLPYKNTDNDEILWRLARAACEYGKVFGGDKKKALTYEAFEYIQRCLQLNDRNFAVHKWYAILLNYTGEYEGTKQSITNAYKVKDHLLRAIELNPKDATTIHSLGFWCLTVADLPWYQQKVASVIFATPPTSSYEEALKYFLDAERVDPDFYSMNLLLLGKTYMRMKKNDDAIKYLTRARDYVVKTEDDKKAHQEAVELLAGLGVKK